MPEEQQDVNAVLAKIDLLAPRPKYAIVYYFSFLEPGERHPDPNRRVGFQHPLTKQTRRSLARWFVIFLRNYARRAAACRLP